MGTFARFNLQYLSQRYGFRTFIETGTNKGHGVQHALNCGINNIHSIELDPSLYFAASVAFSSFPNVYIHHGSSVDIMPDLLNFVASERSIFFWLDAHFQYNYNGFESFTAHASDAKRGIPAAPIIPELKTIFEKRPHNHDLILIDDLSCFVDDPNIPDQAFSTDSLRSSGILPEGFTKESLVGASIDDIEATVPHNYKHERIYHDAGFLFITPRQL